MGVATNKLQAELGLLLPVPTALKKSLALAASEQEGFLMADRIKMAGETVTRLNFSMDKKEILRQLKKAP